MISLRNRHLLILRDARRNGLDGAEITSITFQELRHKILDGEYLKWLFYYRKVTLRTYRAELLNKPFNTMLLVRMLSHGQCILEDETGFRRPITIAYIVTLFFRLMGDLAQKRFLLGRTFSEERQYEHDTRFGKRNCYLDLSHQPIYLRTDLIFGLQSGGSVGHIAGVLNNLGHFCGKPIFFSTDVIPTIDPSIETHIVSPSGRFRDFRELPSFYVNDEFIRGVGPHVKNRPIAFVYQRYSVNNYSGLVLARNWNTPFVLEYNGSEVWIHRNWGNPLLYEDMSKRIETLNLHAAEVIVVVSKVMRDELVQRGLSPDKILVNPNGVDPKRYGPFINGDKIRRDHGLDGKIVLGFIGTFGHWHGAEVLANAFGLLLRDYPQYRHRVRLLMIGDGMTMPEVKRRLADWNAAECCMLTGIVPQEQGPSYLAACDILVSPHVPNPDGTPFFGSPTKLFEYMAMGKGIVASDLDQIGEVLTHDETAWLVNAGNEKALAEGLQSLIEDPGRRQRLGMAAREVVQQRHTWLEHTRRIIDKIQEQCA
jgi:glycosyltransferase involved in cell wall biosynthesis